jgi:hypothetical protein
MLVTSPPHVYHLNPIRLVVIPAIGLGFVALLIAALVFPDADGDDGLWWAVGLVALVFAAAFLIVWKSRLELTDEGIVHYQFGYTVRSTWENVESISLVRGAEGLYLREPGTHSALLRGSSQLLNIAMRVSALPSVVGDPAALAAGRFVALMPFTRHLNGGPLSRDLQRWAPHLFTKPAPSVDG